MLYRTLLAATLCAGSALAQTPTQLNETQGATTGLGSSHRFPTRAAAYNHCANDTIVWSTSPNLIYDLPNSPNYGKGHGFYACKAEADSAGFHPAGS